MEKREESLSQLFEADQAEREDHPKYGTSEYWELRKRDAERRAEATKALEQGTVRSGEDYYHAAMIFQHGETIEEIQRAHELSKKAAEMGYRPARYLAAAAYDRWLMYQGKPQKYGTNIVPDGKRQRVWDVDPSTTDKERAEWDVSSLADQHRKAEEISKTEPMPPMDQAPRWLKDAIKRWYPDERL